MPPDERRIDALHVRLREIPGQQHWQHGQAQTLLERADHEKIRKMDAVIALLFRLRQELRSDIIVDHRGRDGLRLLEIRRQEAQILRQKLNDLLHIQAEIRDLVPIRQAVAPQNMLPPAELADDEAVIICHLFTHTFLIQYSIFYKKSKHT